MQTLAHLTCVSSTGETVHQKIKEIKAAGIENIMALRGDIPADMDLSHQETWAYHHAIDLIRELKESGADFASAAPAIRRSILRARIRKRTFVSLRKRLTPAVNF